jgi:hypothetical protein
MRFRSGSTVRERVPYYFVTIGGIGEKEFPSRLLDHLSDVLIVAAMVFLLHIPVPLFSIDQMRCRQRDPHRRPISGRKGRAQAPIHFLTNLFRSKNPF